jgi:SAM-dependent methyltransferase
MARKGNPGSMPAVDPYAGRVEKYDRWYEDHLLAYQAELEAVRKLLPRMGEGLEVGIGTARFAKRLNIIYGVEPSKSMREFAQAQGLKVVDGVAEDLPYDDSRFDFVLMVTVLHLLDDPPKAMQECYRVIRPGGHLVIGFIDRDSPVGRKYIDKAAGDKGKKPHFFTPAELTRLLEETGFSNFQFFQTLFRDPEILESPEPVVYGYGEGSFVVVRAAKV